MNKSIRHLPFIIRKDLVMGSLIPALISGIFTQNIYLVLSIYFIVVTLSDVLIRYGLGKKSSDYINPELLVKEQEVEPPEFDKYCDSRTLIRVLSLGTAFCGGFGAYLFLQPSLVFFSFTYIGSTLLLSLIGDVFSLVKEPVLIKILPRCTSVAIHQRTPGTVTPSEYAARQATGLPPMPIEW